MKKIILLKVCLSIIFSSCCIYCEDVTPFYVGSRQAYLANKIYVPFNEILNHINPQEVKYVFDNITSSMCTCIRSYSKIIVTDLPNLSYFKTDKLSSYFGDILRTSVSDICKATIILPDLSKYLEFSRLGVKIRTREVKKLLHQKYRGYSIAFLTGTYQISGNTITVFVKLIDARTGKVICAKEGIINIYP